MLHFISKALDCFALFHKKLTKPGFSHILLFHLSTNKNKMGSIPKIIKFRYNPFAALLNNQTKSYLQKSVQIQFPVYA